MKTISRFHSQNGLFFHRLEDGSVMVTKTSDELSISDDNIAFQIVLTDSVWASVVSSMSAKGETGQTYQMALTFHNDPYIPHTIWPASN